MRNPIYVSLFTLVAVIFAARAARAEPGAVLVSGTAKAQQQLVVASSVATAVRAAGWTLDDKPYNAADSAVAADCLRKPEPWACISALLRDKRIQRVAIVSVDPKPGKNGTTDTVITERLVVANMDSLFVAQRFCDHCTDDRLAGLAAEVTKELLDRVAVGSGDTVVAVKSVPRGARVYIDSNLVGVTDTSINIVPGAHTIAVELEGYAPATRNVVVQANTTQEVAFPLRPSTNAGGTGFAANGGTSGSPGGPGKSPDNSRWRLAAKLGTGLGAAAFVTGIVLFAIDEDPITQPDQKVSPCYRDTAPAGVIVGVSGLVVAGVGGYLWWKFPKTSPTPVVAPVSGGAVVGLTRSF
jgi:PEGA domain